MKREFIGRALVLAVLVIVVVVPLAVVLPRNGAVKKRRDESRGAGDGEAATEPPQSQDHESPTVSPVYHPSAAPLAVYQPSTTPSAKAGELTANPSRAPIAPTPLVTPVRPCTQQDPCQLCEGHCSGDSVCRDPLVCFKKAKGEPVPFCDGQDFSRTSWCTFSQALLPSSAPSSPSSTPTSSPSSNPSSSPSTSPSRLPIDTSSHPTTVPSGSPTVLPSISASVASSTSDNPTTPSPTDPPTVSPGSLDLMYLAYYYPWYIKNDWSQHGYVDTPKLGLYGTDDPSVAEQHIEWAVRAGIDAFVVSWWKPYAITSQHMARGLFNAGNIGDIKFAVNYETKGALPTDDFGNGTVALDTFIADMQYLEANYFTHPSYVRLNGRPLVVLYITRTWQNFEPYMLDQVRASLSEDVLFLADEPYHGKQKFLDEASNGIKDGKPIFEAYTTYNMFENFLIREGESATDYMLREGLPIFERWSKETLFFPNVLPMYHDFRGHLPLWGDAAGLTQQLQVFSCLPRPSWYEQGSLPDMIFITSWNEWWEGSQVEPDKDGRYGFEFIDAFKAFKHSGWKCFVEDTD